MPSGDEGRIQKMILVQGIYDGLVFGRSPDLASYPRRADWDTLVDGLDKFYADFANRKVFVIWALRVLQLELSGAPQATIDAEINLSRCRAGVLGQPLSSEERNRQLQQCPGGP
jgi:hypothetical protein